jgi:hypothetical protein
MLYQHPSRPSIMRASDSFTRPADTTAYSAGDLVANSVTAASVVPLSWTVSRTPLGLVKLNRALIRKNDDTVTNSTFNLYLFNASPTIATTGDNGAFTSVVSGYDKMLGRIQFPAMTALADGAFSDEAATAQDNNWNCPLTLAPASGRIIYGLLAATATYVPASEEIFTVELEFERA